MVGYRLNSMHELLLEKNHYNSCQQMSDFKAEMHLIRLLADRTNGRTYSVVLCPSLSVVCNVDIVVTLCVLPKNCLKKQIGKGLWGIE